jgi:hypothetical protein
MATPASMPRPAEVTAIAATIFDWFGLERLLVGLLGGTLWRGMKETYIYGELVLLQAS